MYMFNLIHNLAASCQNYFYRSKRYVSPEASVVNSKNIYPWSAVWATSSVEFVRVFHNIYADGIFENRYVAFFYFQ